MQNNFKFGDIIIHQEKGRGVVVATFLNSIDVVFDGDRKIKTLSLKCEKVTLEHQENQQSAWVSVKDALPEPNVIVAVIYEINGRQYADKAEIFRDDDFDNGNPYFDVCREDRWQLRDDVTHWQPLPEPPQDSK